jgi:hypothetical protein
LMRKRRRGKEGRGDEWEGEDKKRIVEGRG